MLITTCAHCQARFRVTPQQLNARQGQVRCGKCTQVFNGFQVLERFPDDDTGGRLLAQHEAQRNAEAAAAGLPPPPPIPTDVVDLPLDDSPARAATDAASVPDLPLEPPSADLPSRPARRTHPAAQAALEPEVTLEMEPEPPPARAWRFGAVFLAIVLALELAYALRGPLAQRYPVLRQPLESACSRLGCTVPWSRVEEQIRLEDSELLEVPGRPNEIALGARVRNLATVAQEYPHLELTLTDLTGQAAVRRVLRPTDYLGRPLAHGEVIAPGAEVSLQLRLETPRIKATGYQILVFYP
jgi:predicted Zn finger-like uncharacterized protein